MFASLLEFFGRLHPVVLHLPIGLLIGLAALEIFASLRKKPLPPDLVGALAWLAAGCALLAAATGFILGGGAYEGETVDRHRILGIALAAVALSAALLHRWAKSRWAYRPALILAVGLLIPAGHLGGTLTHGEGYLTAPFDAPAGDSTYATEVAPIFARRCAGCHGASKQENDLALHTPESIRKYENLSEIARRIRLRVGDKDHMPPKGKPQPSADEIRTIESWIAAGAPFTGRIAAPRGVPPANPAAVEALKRKLAHVEPDSAETNALRVDFAAVPKMPEDEIRALLTPLREQVSDLSLARCAVGDETLRLAGRMPNLRRLDLRAAGVTDAGVAHLRNHPKLETLNLAQTKLTDDSVEVLLTMPSLRRLHLWRSGITAGGNAKLRERKSLEVEADDDPTATALEVEPELKLGGAPPPAGASLAPVNKTCPVTDRPLDPRYSVVHQGRVVGFC